MYKIGVFNIFFLTLIIYGKNPTCTIIAPTNESTFTSPATIKIVVTGNDSDGKIDTLKLLSNGTVICIVTKDTLSYTLNDIGTDTYNLQAVAIDEKDNSSDTAELKFFVTTPKNYVYKESLIKNSSDDAEESVPDFKILLDNNDLDFMLNQIIGLRFKNMDIPPKAQINHAYIQFTCKVPSEEGSVLAITGELAGDSKTFAGTIADISSRPSTMSSVAWNPDPWVKAGESGYIHQTPNLREIIQEIIGQESYSRTSPITLLLRGEGLSSAASFDGDAKSAPILRVEYANSDTTNHAPIAKFIYVPIKGKAPLIITYDAKLSSDPDGDSLVYLWDFGDGTESYDVSGTHTYIDTGIYSVILKVTDSNNAIDIASIKIAVTDSNTIPISKIIADPEIGMVPLEVHFDGTNALDPDGDILHYLWDFGDGMISNQIKETHIYNTPGNYVATLIVNDGIKYDTTEIDIIVNPKQNQKPVVDFIIDTIPEEPYSRIFDASNSSDPDGNNLQYIWSFGDGNISFEKTTKHTYMIDGTYNVTLTILDEDNNTMIKEITLKINNPYIE